MASGVMGVIVGKDVQTFLILLPHLPLIRLEAVFSRHSKRGHVCLPANGPSKAEGNGLPHKSFVNRE